MTLLVGVRFQAWLAVCSATLSTNHPFWVWGAVTAGGVEGRGNEAAFAPGAALSLFIHSVPSWFPGVSGETFKEQLAGSQSPCRVSIPWDRSVRDTAGSRAVTALSCGLLFDFSRIEMMGFSFPSFSFWNFELLKFYVFMYSLLKILRITNHSSKILEYGSR